MSPTAPTAPGSTPSRWTSRPGFSVDQTVTQHIYSTGQERWYASSCHPGAPCTFSTLASRGGGQPALGPPGRVQRDHESQNTTLQFSRTQPPASSPAISASTVPAAAVSCRSSSCPSSSCRSSSCRSSFCRSSFLPNSSCLSSFLPQQFLPQQFLPAPYSGAVYASLLAASSVPELRRPDHRPQYLERLRLYVCAGRRASKPLDPLQPQRHRD